MMEIFHVLNRGVDKRNIFLDDQDRFRFIHDLFEFNDENRVDTASYYNYIHNRSSQCDDIECRHINRFGYDKKSLRQSRKPRQLLVDILVFCLMGNHYHLLLSPLVKEGIPRFMKKLNMGYAKYFNEKYKRKGALFEGRYRSVPVIEEKHLSYLPYYIHFNPLDFVFPNWRNGNINNQKKAITYLKKYRWSSHLDYLGIKNFPSITSRDYMLKILGGSELYEKNIEDWLKEMDSEKVGIFTLE